MKAHLKALLLVCVLALFGWYLTKLGPAKVFSVIAGLGAWAPLVLVPYFVVYIVDCLAWSQTLPSGNLPFWTRFRIRWAGESVNNLVPTAYVGGEAAKVLLLRPYGISGHDGAVAAVVSKTAQTVAQLFFIVGASAVFFQLAKDQPKLRLGISFILVGGMAAVGLLFWVQKLGLFRMFLGRQVGSRRQVIKSCQAKPSWVEPISSKLELAETPTANFFKHLDFSHGFFQEWASGKTLRTAINDSAASPNHVGIPNWSELQKLTVCGYDQLAWQDSIP